MSLHSSSSVNGEGSTPKDPLYKILDELRSLKLWKEKQERKEKGKKRVEEISQGEREKIREEERRKIMKEMKREKHVSYSSHNSCKSLSEELSESLKTIASGADTEKIVHAIYLMSAFEQEVRQSTQQNLLFESLIIKLCFGFKENYWGEA